MGTVNEYNANQASPIGVYIDDVYIAPRTSQGMGLFDLERVEVLRGPQGTLFGRNTTGGAINFLSRSPALSGSKGSVEFGYGSFNTVQAQATAEITPVDDVLGIRIAANYIIGDGEIKNLSPGALNPNSLDTLQGRFSLRFRPKGGLLDVKIRIYDGRDQPTAAAVHGYAPSRAGLNFFETRENLTGLNRSDAWGAAANVAVHLSHELQLTSITSVDGGSQNLAQAAWDGTDLNLLPTASAPLGSLYINWRSTFSQFSQEVRLNYSHRGLELVGGAFYGSDRNETQNTFYIGDVLGPGADGGFLQHFRQVRKSTAVFAQADFKVTDRLTLTAGARYTWDNARYEDAYAYLFAGSPPSGPITPLLQSVPCAGVGPACPYDPNARFSLTGASQALTGRLALSYLTRAGTLLYASYNRGYRSGAFNGGSYTDDAGINYVRPEEVNAYEIGAKGRFFDRALTTSLSGFYYDYSDQQLQDTRPGPTNILVNAPKARIFGMDGDATLKLSPTLSLDGSIGLLNATYLKLTLQGVNLAGGQMPFAPDMTARLGLDWRAAEFGGGELHVEPSINYVSNEWFSPFADKNPTPASQNGNLHQGGYAKVNASTTWTRGDLSVRLWVDNLFNRGTYVYGLDLLGPGFPYNFLVPSTPRTFGASVRVKF